MTTITIYSRLGCHLCEDAESTLESLRAELNFEIEVIYIEDDAELIRLYSDQVPVIHIDGEHHDFFRVDVERFKSCLYTHRLRQ